MDSLLKSRCPSVRPNCIAIVSTPVGWIDLVWMDIHWRRFSVFFPYIIFLATAWYIFSTTSACVFHAYFLPANLCFVVQERRKSNKIITSKSDFINLNKPLLAKYAVLFAECMDVACGVCVIFGNVEIGKFDVFFRIATYIVL